MPNQKRRDELRNIAIIAHVDHGKTTLVDAILRQSGMFRSQQLEDKTLILDNNALERERGITILAKNVAMTYPDSKGVTRKINIIDTPGHADFGGEVERVLKMADGVLLVVDAFEGPMPQTRFVLKKAFHYHLKPIVVINKIDRNDARSNEVLNEVFDLFVELEATDDQLDFPVIYASGRAGFARLDPADGNMDMRPLLETIVTKINGPVADIEKPLQLQITNIDYSEYVGRIGIGRVFNGTINKDQQVALLKRNGKTEKHKIVDLYLFEGLGRAKTPHAEAGDICAVVGIDDVDIGDTIADIEKPEALPLIDVDEPTLNMIFSVNDSPFAGREKLPALRKIVQTDVTAAYEGDPAARSVDEIIVAYPCVLVISLQRVAHVLYHLGIPLLPRMLTEFAHERTGCDIHPGARLGSHFFIDHGTGVVIGETATVGSHVKLYQGVTLGAKSFETDPEGRPIKGVKRHPDIGDHVTIYAHATILGGDTSIGANSVIGSNVWMMKSIPADSVAYFKGDSVVVRSRRKHETLVGSLVKSTGADSAVSEWQI